MVMLRHCIGRFACGQLPESAQAFVFSKNGSESSFSLLSLSERTRTGKNLSTLRLSDFVRLRRNRSLGGTPVVCKADHFEANNTLPVLSIAHKRQHDRPSARCTPGS